MPFERFKEKHGGMGPAQALYAGYTGGEGLFGNWRPAFARDRVAQTLDAIREDGDLPDEFKERAEAARHENFTVPEAFATVRALEQRARDIKTINGAFSGFGEQQQALRDAAMSDADHAQLDVLDTQAEYGRRLMLSDNPELQAMGRSVTEKVFAGQQSFATTNEAQRITAETTLGAENWARYSALQDNYRAESAPFLEQRAAFGRVKAALAVPDSPAGDQALVFNFMKILDPGSAVLPGEYASASNTDGVPPAMLTLYNRLLREGQRLTPEQRRDFYKQATEQLTAAQALQTERDSRYLGQARDVGIPEAMLKNFQLPRADAGGAPNSFGSPQGVPPAAAAGDPPAPLTGGDMSNWPKASAFIERAARFMGAKPARETDEYTPPRAAPPPLRRGQDGTVNGVYVPRFMRGGR